MNVSEVRRKDTTRGPPLRILSLDGGGIRGYSMLVILSDLMYRTHVEIEGKPPRRNEIPKPCDHFDLIVGTGTGGLIALMLGRLRLDLETCKELYVRMTRMVFQTDKRIIGLPYSSTLFKASKLEEAIKEAVRDHTVNEQEGNDGTPLDSVNPLSATSRSSAGSYPKRHTSNASVLSFSQRSPTSQKARPNFYSGYGDPNARLHDEREYRTKTAVTAVYRGSKKGYSAAVLRSYESRKEPELEFDVKIWQAGRATSAIGFAFKPIRIGQHEFHDDGEGDFNPSVTALDEACVNEWPGRDVGVFVSIGTGKRPKSSDGNQSMWYDGFLSDFADARKKLISKIEGCEAIHEYVVKEHLSKRGVNIENYYRFNVEVGVGEFSMNEWYRLAEISQSTRQYLGLEMEQKMIQGTSSKLAKIHKANKRWHRMGDVPELVHTTTSEITSPLAVELPGDIPASFPAPNSPPPNRQSYDRQSYESGQAENLNLPTGSTTSPHSSSERLQPANGAAPRPRHSPPANRTSGPAVTNSGVPNDDPDRLMVTAPTPGQYRNAAGADKIAIVNPDDQPRHVTQPHRTEPHRIEPPPLPPKTPLPEHAMGGHRHAGGAPPPYPDDDRPPVVNMARKPNFRGR